MQNLFSYPLVVDELSAAQRRYKFKAEEKELKFIADVLKVVDAKSFEADLNVKLSKKEHQLKVWGKVKAELELMSVISLENFTKTYEPEFEINYDTQLSPKDLREMTFEFDDEVPDVIIDGKIDLAEIAMEQIALVIDDFPRQDGEVFEFESEFDEETTEKMNPFAVLAKLKK